MQKVYDSFPLWQFVQENHVVHWTIAFLIMEEKNFAELTYCHCVEDAEVEC